MGVEMHSKHLATRWRGGLCHRRTVLEQAVPEADTPASKTWQKSVAET